jgi:Predicted ATPase (AAA+ superfamily)
MRRKIYDQLLSWKQNSNGTTALLIEGARRVGKSYIAKAFAEKEYKSYVLIDFFRAPREVKQLFYDYLDDLPSLFLYISQYYSVELYERNTLFVFDEVQEFPQARAAIKYLVEDGRFDYLETGSLVSIKKNVGNIIIPSEEEHISLNPMDFEEFLWAIGDENLMGLVSSCFLHKKPLGPLMHRRAMGLFRKYMIVGGMPQAVEKYLETESFEQVDIVKRRILRLYEDDIAKHAGTFQLKVKDFFRKIPSELNRHEKKFRVSSLSKGARMREWEEPIFWVNDAKLTNLCFNSYEPNIGLKMNLDASRFKCYFFDTGLLLSMAFDENGIVSEEVYKKILFDKLEFNNGMVVENLVAQILVSTGHELYFFSSYSKNSEDRMEIDFLIRKKTATSRHNICPVEVKSSSHYTLSSLNKYRKKYQDYTDVSYVVHTNDYEEKDGIVYLPLYMAYCL